MGSEEIRVYRPKSMGVLLRLYSRNPDALVFAGGTGIACRTARGRQRPLDLPEKVLFLGHVQELQRISRSPRYLDIGACVPMGRILSIGRNVLPPVLYDALSAIATPAVRSIATLGGNLCSTSNSRDGESSPGEGGGCLAALSVMEAQVELRSGAATRWLRIGPQFCGAKPGEIVSRIRIPLEEWELQVFRKSSGGKITARGLINFAATARFSRGVLEAVHFCFEGRRLPVFRSRELEARLKNTRLPIRARGKDDLLGELPEQLRPLQEGSRGPPPSPGYARSTAVRLLGWFIELINELSLSR